VVPSFTRPFSSWLLFLGYVKRESVLNEGYRFKPHENALPVSVLKLTAMQTYSMEFTYILQSASNYALKMMEIMLKILFVNIRIESNFLFYKVYVFYHAPRLCVLFTMYRDFIDTCVSSCYMPKGFTMNEPDLLNYIFNRVDSASFRTWNTRYCEIHRVNTFIMLALDYLAFNNWQQSSARDLLFTFLELNRSDPFQQRRVSMRFKASKPESSHHIFDI